MNGFKRTTIRHNPVTNAIYLFNPPCPSGSQQDAPELAAPNYTDVLKKFSHRPLATQLIFYCSKFTQRITNGLHYPVSCTHNLRFLVFVALSTFITATLSGLSPNDERWNKLIQSHSGQEKRPEDTEMGLLADIIDPSPSWAGALALCEEIFKHLEKGELPSELFFDSMRLPLETAFNNLLKPGKRVAGDRRYALPKRDGDRVSIQIRLNSGDTPVYGYAYLILIGEDWRVEQWALDLSGTAIVKDREEKFPEAELGPNDVQDDSENSSTT